MYINKKIKDFLKRIIKKPYYYVSPCPLCESEITGRFVPLHREVDTEWVIKESLKNGEIVNPIKDIEEHNCFCAECDATWFEPISLKMFSLKKIEEEKDKRFTREILKGIEEEKEEEERLKQNNGITGMFTKFAGKF